MEGPWHGCVPGKVLALSGSPSALVGYKVPIIDKRNAYAKEDKLGPMVHRDVPAAWSVGSGAPLFFLVLALFVDYYVNSAYE